MAEMPGSFPPDIDGFQSNTGKLIIELHNTNHLQDKGKKRLVAKPIEHTVDKGKLNLYFTRYLLTHKNSTLDAKTLSD